MKRTNNQIEKREGITLEGQILTLRNEAQNLLIEFYDYKDIRRFREFKKALLRFYQMVRVYIEKSDKDYEILEDLDREILEGVSENESENKIEKWMEYHQELERVLFDIGITNILKAHNISN